MIATGFDALAAAADRGELATKADLETGLARLEIRLVRFVLAVAAGQAVLIVGLLKLLP